RVPRTPMRILPIPRSLLSLPFPIRFKLLFPSRVYPRLRCRQLGPAQNPIGVKLEHLRLRQMLGFPRCLYPINPSPSIGDPLLICLLLARLTLLQLGHDPRSPLPATAAAQSGRSSPAGYADLSCLRLAARTSANSPAMSFSVHMPICGQLHFSL